MSDITDFLIAFASFSEDPDIQADADAIGDEISSVALRGGVTRSTDVVITPPKPKGGGGLPWLRARNAVQRVLEHVQVRSIGVSPADAPALFSSLLETIVSDWTKPVGLALSATDARLLFGGELTPTDLAFAASEMNTLARFLPVDHPSRGPLMSARNALASAAKDRLDPPEGTLPP